MLAQPRDLGIVEVNAVCQPHALIQPADLFQIIQRPAAIMMQTVVVFVMCFGEVGMKPAIVLFGKRRGIDHQLPGDVERSARRQRDLPERTLAQIVIFEQHALAVGNDRVVILHQAFVGDPTACRVDIDGAPRQGDAHSQFRCFFGLDVDGIGHVGRKHEQMI